MILANSMILMEPTVSSVIPHWLKTEMDCCMTSEGGMYGKGVIFSFNPQTKSFVKLYDFDGANGAVPYGSLKLLNGKLFGLTRKGGNADKGIIFSFQLQNNGFAKIHDFDGTDGANPNGSLMQFTNGELFGVTTGEGTFGDGTLFSINPQTGAFFTHLHLNGTYKFFGSLALGKDGKIWGILEPEINNRPITFEKSGNIFTYEPYASYPAFTIRASFNVANGSVPVGGILVTETGEYLCLTKYGSQAPYEPAPGMVFPGYGVSLGFGTLTSISPTTYNLNTLYDFSNIEGSSPYGGFITLSDYTLVAQTTRRAWGNAGAIFTYQTGSKKFDQLHAYSSGGWYNTGSLAMHTDGSLYGVQNSQYDAFFRISSFNPNTTNFSGTTFFWGQHGNSGGLLSSEGRLFGMNYMKDISTAGSYGEVFSHDPGSNVKDPVLLFNGTNGSKPYGRLLQGPYGLYFGMTSEGGAYNKGVIFSVNASGTQYEKIHEFDGNDGAYPFGALVWGPDGKLWGMTSGGGANDDGVIFSVDPPTKGYTKAHEFSYANGSKPVGDLLAASDGRFYAFTSIGGSYDLGILFSFDPATKTFKKLADFNGQNGRNPYGSLFEQKQPEPAIYAGGPGRGDFRFFHTGQLPGLAVPGMYSGGSGKGDISIRHIGRLAGLLSAIYSGGSGRGDKSQAGLMSLQDANLAGLYRGGLGRGDLARFNLVSLKHPQLAGLYAGGSGRGDIVSSQLVSLKDPAFAALYAGGSGRGDFRVARLDLLQDPASKGLYSGGSGRGDHSLSYLGSLQHPLLYGLYRGGPGRGDVSGLFTGNLYVIPVPAQTGNERPNIKTLSGLQVKVLPNPSQYQFEVRISGRADLPVFLRVTDILGRVIEERKLKGGMQYLMLGAGWQNGSYFLEVSQGNQRNTNKLILMK
jgi:uncharacterized repeat protein (TIGR03803 family)